MNWITNLLRRARFRGLAEGTLVQRGTVEAFDQEARRTAERHQDYGFAAMPVEGEGLRLEVGGHTIILRMDRTAERPHLAPFEVAVWHKEGHQVVLRAGQLVAVQCRELLVQASERVRFETPSVEGTGDATWAGTVTGETDVIADGISGKDHLHGGVRRGIENSDGPR